MIGQTVSHYRIMRLLGEGGMGTVYAAEDTHLGRTVAIKFLNASNTDHHYRARFLREARAISSLSHPNIATVFDYGETSDAKPFLVMEFVEGETLGELLDSSALTVWRSVEIIGCVADALAEAHNRGIVHRDIKPSNVIITNRGQVKVLDFGLAKRISEEEIHNTDTNAPTLLSTHTRDGIVVGTPLYLSPEQATGSPVDGRSDLFALGALLYECISGKPAFSGSSVLEIGGQVIHVDPRPPSEINPEVPLDLNRITLKALAKRPEDRYQTAEELREELITVHSALNVEGERVRRITYANGRSHRTSALTTISQTLRKPRVSLFTLAATVLAVGVIVIGLVLYFRPKPYKPPQEARKFYELGTDFIREGAYHQASKALEKAISIDPNFALAHARLAEAWTELDYSDKAKDEMLRVSALVPNRSGLTKLDNLYLDAISSVVTHDFERAAGYYQEIVKAAPEKPDAYVDLGRAYEKNEQVNLALESYIKATYRDSQYALANLRAAEMYIRKREVPSAISALEKAGNLYDAIGNIEGSTEVLFYRGVLLTDTSKYQEAFAPLQKALNLATSTGNAQQQFNATLQMSRLAFQMGDVNSAREYANTARRIAEQQGLNNLVIFALVELGNAFNGWNEYDKAEPVARLALGMAQRNNALRLEASSKLILGIALMQTLRAKEGFPLIEQAHEFFLKGNYLRQVSYCLTYVGREHRRKGEYELALAAYRQKLEISERAADPKEVAFARADIAMAYAKQERYIEALGKYDESNEINRAREFWSGLTYNQMNRASVLLQLGRYEEARTSLDEASSLANKTKGGLKAVLAEVQMILGQIALSNRDFTKAKQYSVEAVSKAGTQYPDVAIGAKIALGTGQAFSGATADGKRTCEEALKMAQDSGEEAVISDAILALGTALFEYGDFDEALSNALKVQERLARSGEQESEWRAWLLAARCMIRKRIDAQGREYLNRANESLTKLETQWGAEAFDRYQSRPDIQVARKQLSEAALAVP